MEEVIKEVADKADVVTGAVAAGAGWVSTKFAWWKEQPKLVRIGVFLGVFLGVAVVLSVLQGVLG